MTAYRPQTREEWDALRLEVNRRRRAQLAGEGRHAERPTAVRRAMTWLDEYLSCGPRSSADVKAAAREARISPNALRSAREALGVRCANGGRTGATWSLPLEAE